ncbi:MAG: HDOD domain-containing protein [Gammaproteobacteria bacterium]|nr:HDOD domain-containing protein [Gammaproteobacteria bacterium]
MEDIFITRQAIHDSHNEIIGYELLFHDSHHCHASPCSDAEQSAQLIANTFMGIGLENLVGSNKAFLSLSHDFFTNQHPIPMASHQLVLEVSGACLKDEKVYRELQQLAGQGYTLSLYDYDYDETTAGRLDCINIIKIDISRYSNSELKEQSRYYRNHGKRLQIRGISSEAEQLLCRQLGIDYFQGELLAPANTIKERGATLDHNVLQAIIESAQQQPQDSIVLSHIVSHDAVLCYQLLRYLNCASFAERTEIHSLGQALALIGSPTLGHWASLLLTAQPHPGHTNAINDRALKRAEQCHNLALRGEKLCADQAFLTGLLSHMDEALETPMAELLDTLALTTDIAFALLFEEGPLGQLLQQVRPR